MYDGFKNLYPIVFHFASPLNASFYQLICLSPLLKTFSTNFDVYVINCIQFFIAFSTLIVDS